MSRRRLLTARDLRDLRGLSPARYGALVRAGLAEGGGYRALTAVGKTHLQGLDAEERAERARWREQLAQLSVTVNARDLADVLQHLEWPHLTAMPQASVRAFLAAFERVAGPWRDEP